MRANTHFHVGARQIHLVIVMQLYMTNNALFIYKYSCGEVDFNEKDIRNSLQKTNLCI